jgi:ATP synthase I chain
VNDSEYAAIERRIEGFIAALGVAMVAGAAIGWGVRAALGAGVGAALCWLNFRWLRQGAEGLIQLGMAQAGSAVKVPKKIHAKFFGRLMLLLIVVYVILALLRLPAAAVLCGLAVVVPAIMIELGYELIHGGHRWNAQ